VKDALILAALVLVALIAAGLSLLAWHRIANGPPETASPDQLDADDPDV
jgi:hypothetical protein